MGHHETQRNVFRVPKREADYGQRQNRSGWFSSNLPLLIESHQARVDPSDKFPTIIIFRCGHQKLACLNAGSLMNYCGWKRKNESDDWNLSTHLRERGISLEISKWIFSFAIMILLPIYPTAPILLFLLSLLLLLLLLQLFMLFLLLLITERKGGTIGNKYPAPPSRRAPNVENLQKKKIKSL